MKIKKGDKVIIITGKDKGKTGKVLQVFNDSNRVTVEGINLGYRHTKAKKQNEKGQRIQVPGTLQVSNVALISPKDNKAAKIGYKIDNGKKIRIDKKSKQQI